MLRVYDDATGKTLNKGDTIKGFATIGVGRNLMGKGISREESHYLLGNDIADIEKELDALLPQWRRWSEGRQIAIAEMCFNMGTANVVRGWPNTIKAMISGNWGYVGQALLGSKWRAQVGETRAQSIVRLFVTGELS